jgi:hypothetical protein
MLARVDLEIPSAAEAEATIPTTSKAAQMIATFFIVVSSKVVETTSDVTYSLAADGRFRDLAPSSRTLVYVEQTLYANFQD